VQVNWLYIGVAITSVLLLVAVSMVVVPRLVPENEKRGVIVQAVFRTNMVFYALPMAESVFGDEALLATATIIAFIVPTYNILAVIVLEYFRGGAASPRALLISLIKNPLIQGFIVGFVFHFAGWKLPAVVESPILTLANISIPMALVILGGTLHFSEVRENLRYLVPVLSVKMAVLPLIMLLVSLALPLSAPERFMLVLIFAAPVASASYVMAESMGGDGTLAGQLVAFSSAISVVTLFLWVLGMGSAGLL
jgi:predicted permease